MSHGGIEGADPATVEALSVPPGASAGEFVAALAAILPGTDVARTLGAGGMLVQASGKKPKMVPTAAMDAYDVQGAGDTNLAAFWQARLAGAPMVDAALIAHAVSGVAVSKVGTTTATCHEARVRLPEIIAAAF